MKPHVVVLGGNFAGLASAQKIREFCGEAVRITVIDRKNFLLFVPNVPAEVFEGRDPSKTLAMDIPSTLDEDDIGFIQAEIKAIDPDAKKVDFVPSERPGAAPESMAYDYLVVAVGNRLAYDKIEGFAEHGHTVSDFYYGNKLRHFLANEYKGGPVAIGSARFHQGDGTKDIKLYGGHAFPSAEAACEGPPVETMLSMATWLGQHGKGGPDKITVFTPASLIAEDAGEKVVGKLLEIAGGMGFNYVNEAKDITRITKDGVELASGKNIEAELKLVFPDWVPHDFMKGLPISDNEGFVITDVTMRNPKYPQVFAAGDAAAITVPKLGGIGHAQSEIVAKQIAKDMGKMTPAEADKPLEPVVYCIGDMGNNQAFYIRSNSWFGGPDQVLKMGHMPFLLKMQYKNLFFKTKGKMPEWGLDASKLLAEKLFAA
ncbi:pyridine nucleotide-disulfide oxidoreductase [Acidithiobacillus marinus]|uniref:Pyridine nucleotide-disulfide oxidoreductase n=1 Tax=Acidithiobacillus marinus TaxID=187490 RepID=A0A2I1DKP1_9PROT|nr:FAD-dependent oxidoreductase [Acidithiobacillus marinus]PKY10440.1 pyridine nucleotide-disulfide oxidoreductase [Acidithiobacillus marinus]